MLQAVVASFGLNFDLKSSSFGNYLQTWVFGPSGISKVKNDPKTSFFF
jgi:hypothetical protein